MAISGIFYSLYNFVYKFYIVNINFGVFNEKKNCIPLTNTI